MTTQQILSVAILLVTACSGAYSVGLDFYTAAVYEHAMNFTAAGVNSRVEALQVMKSNLDTLEKEVSKAQMADIFVFPEYGLYSRLDSRFTASQYAEQIPQPSNSSPYCPCINSSIPTGQEVLHRLSCISRNKHMYLAINMADRQPCSDSDKHCPSNGQYQYNTEVVFDRNGCLIARYHKQNLFEAETLMWDTPAEVEHSFFDTEFGRFGLMVCFDAVFKEPAISLVETHHVTDIIFSTAWMNVFPHYASVAYHSGWARNLKVNYLASNIHDVPNSLVGSGIYGPDGIIDYTFNVTTSSGTLVVAQVPINNRSLPNSNPPVAPTLANSISDQSFSLSVFGDLFEFQALHGLNGTSKVCDGNVCCTMDFSRTATTEEYAVGAFDGMHTIEGEYYFEICMLVRCSNNYTECGSPVAEVTDTEFLSYSLFGSMPTKHVFPEVVGADSNFTTDWEYYSSGNDKWIHGSSKRIFSIVLMGRNFDKDPKPPQPFHEATTSTASSNYKRVSFELFMLHGFVMCVTHF